MKELRLVEIGHDSEDGLKLFREFVARGPKGHILQTFEWGELKRRTGWEPVRFLLEEAGPGGRPRAAVSVLLRRLPLPGRFCLAYAPRGPVLDYTDEEAVAALFSRLRAVLRRRGAIALKIDPDIEVDRADVVQLLRRNGLKPLERGMGFEGVQPKFVFRLPLRGSAEEILASFSAKTRYNLRLAQRRGVSVRSASDPGEMTAFYRVLLETARRDGFLVRAESYYHDIWALLVKPGLARLFLAEHEGDILAGAIAFILGDKVWYVYGASSNTRREVMPNYLLQWAMIRWALDEGCTLYDFRGVSGNTDPSDPLYGLYRFKKGFGATLTEFIGEFDLVLRPALYHLYTVGEPAYRRLRGRLRRTVTTTAARGD